MKHNIWPICIFVLAFCVSGCSRKDSHEFAAKEPNTTQVLQTNYDPSNQVKSYELLIYDDKSHHIKTLYYNKNKELLSDDKINFNQDGNLISLQKGDVAKINVEYEYDESGRLQYEHIYDENQELAYSYCYVYDENGNLTLKNTVYPEDIISEASYYTTYEYDQDGLLSAEKKYEGVGDTHLTDCVKYYYESGLLTRKECYDCVGETLTETDRAVYTYDEQQRYEKISCYHGDELYEYTTYTYIE